jgi:hypothetical protein
MPTTTCYGWGVQAWGTPWGGYCETIDDRPSGGFIGGGAQGSRYEQVRRQQELREEQREEHNVVFRVKGVRAYAHVGRVASWGGRGLTAFVRGLRAQVSTHPVTVEALTSVAPLSREQTQMLLGQVTVEGSVGPRGVRAQMRIGKPTIRAVRNLTDEELINFLDDML